MTEDEMASLSQWTWVWVNSGSLWWTGRPGVLWSMGLQRVRHDWMIELNVSELTEYHKAKYVFLCHINWTVLKSGSWPLGKLYPFFIIFLLLLLTLLFFLQIRKCFPVTTKSISWIPSNFLKILFFSLFSFIKITFILIQTLNRKSRFLTHF